MAVSDKPGGTYNPLFIYGASGLGKTHLMHAIGHRLLATNPRAKVVYVSSEKFTNEVITGIRTDSMNDLRKRYRDLDLLLIDDIQFIERTTATQEEFFHTFNALYEHGKQIVIAGDRPPKQLPQIEERLRTRFEWGLQTDIQAPDLETRIAILRKKADLETIVVPDDVLDFIAGAMCDNVRELEGAYLKVVAFASIHGRPVSRELAIEVLGTANVRPITMARICEVVAEAYNVTAEDLVGPRRVKEFTLPRHIACYLVREMTGASFQAIGRHFRRDHTSIMHGIKNISEELLCDTNLGANIAHLKSRISQR
jgi:chromosomal replication initiator protein